MEHSILPSKAEALDAAHRLRLQRRQFLDARESARQIARHVTKEHKRKYEDR